MTPGGEPPFDGECPGCQRALRPGMNFCPGCGRGLRGPAPRTGPVPSPAMAQGALRFQAPVGAQYPPFTATPGMYPPPVSAKRAGAMASAVFSLISASFAFVGGLIYLSQGLGSRDLWLLMGALCFLAFALAILGTIAIGRRTWRSLALMADLALVAIGALALADQVFVGIVVLSMALVALTLLLASWGQFMEEYLYGYPYPPALPPTASAWQLPSDLGTRPPGPVPPGRGAPPPRSADGEASIDEFAGHG